VGFPNPWRDPRLPSSGSHRGASSRSPRRPGAEKPPLLVRPNAGPTAAT
jgi:hypothetical protein